MSDLKDKPKHLEVVVDGDRALVRSPHPIKCGGCNKLAYFFVNKDGVTLCTHCSHERSAT